jgi:hypothetical protein
VCYSERISLLPIIQFALSQRVRLRKKHPCGGFDWLVIRLGGDIGIRCETCGRRILLPRSELERRIKTVLPSLEEVAPQLLAREARIGVASVRPIKKKIAQPMKRSKGEHI